VLPRRRPHLYDRGVRRGWAAILDVVPSNDYADGLSDEIDKCFKITGLPDHRDQYPWLRGWLGDPEAPVWFISEAPSEWRVERDGQAADNPEAQWAISDGDKEFRAALTLAGFKEGQPLSPGGWRSYVTVLANFFGRLRDLALSAV
jgi:hypothetical protein